MKMVSPPPTDDAASLCTACGLCCNGALFDRARAEPDEIPRMKAHGVTIFTDSKADRLRLPCPLLEGNACTIYDQRFTVCRTFECKTLKAAKGGEIGVDEALARIAKAKELIARASEDEPAMAQAEARHRRFREGPPVGDAARGKAFVALLALDRYLDRHFRNKPIDRGFEEIDRK